MERTVSQYWLRIMALLLAGALLGGCASTGGPASPTGGTPGDPLEPINRRVFVFNEAVDRNVVEPVARGYRAVTPGPVDRGITNFFGNLDDVTVLVNSALQLKGRKAAATTLRLALNTTFGIFGIIDIASGLGIPKENEDFGQTLGHWGIGAGPYLVVPVLGPSSLRDGPSQAVDAQYSALDALTTTSRAYYGALAIYGVDARADLLGATRVLDTAAIDPYSYMRDAWLRRRTSLVHDGMPPPDAPATDDGFDPFSDEDDDLFEGPADGSSGGAANP